MTQQLNLLDQAKQGDVEAIATLINQQVQPKGITVRTTLDTSKSVITATPKTDGIKSYIGAVFLVEKGSEVNTVAVVCESNSPSKTPPASPQLNGNEPACPAGSSKL